MGTKYEGIIIDIVEDEIQVEDGRVEGTVWINICNEDDKLNNFDECPFVEVYILMKFDEDFYFKELDSYVEVFGENNKSLGYKELSELLSIGRTDYEKLISICYSEAESYIEDYTYNKYRDGEIPKSDPRDYEWDNRDK